MIYRVRLDASRFIEIEESVLKEFHRVYKHKAIIWEDPVDFVSWKGSGVYCPFFKDFEVCYREFLFNKKVEELFNS